MMKGSKPQPGTRSRSTSRSSVAPSNQKLFLNINVHRAADLVDHTVAMQFENRRKHKNINPVLLAHLNGVTRKTRRKISTNHPSWDDVLSLPLKFNENQSAVVTLTVWDKHRGYKNYLGELRVKLTELFAGSVSTELKWYKLYSSKSFQTFVTGSVLVSFELVVKEKRAKHKRTSSKMASSQDVVNNTDIEVVIQGPSRQNTEHSAAPSESFSRQFSELSVVDELTPIQATVDKRRELFDMWKTYLTEDSGPLKTNEQGFYSDSDFHSDFAQEMSDVDSIVPVSISSSKGSFQKDESHLEPAQILQSKLQDNINSDVSSFTSLSEGSILSSDYLRSYSDEAELEENISPPFPDNKEEPTSRRSRLKKKLRLRKSKLKKKMTDLSPFDLKDRKVNGVLFLEIVSCSGLPAFKNFVRLGFDMDPFVVVTFGKKTFRTSWKRHTLNPVFNERLAFEVLENETNYDVNFLVLDKDRLSLHDDVASVSIPLKDIMSSATAVFPAHTIHMNSSEIGSATSLSSFNDFTDSENPKNSSITMLDNPNMVESMEKKHYLRAKKLKLKFSNTSKFKTMNLALKVENEKYREHYSPTLKVRARYETYSNLRRQFWNSLLSQYNVNEKPGQYDYIELISLLDTLGCINSDTIVKGFFEGQGKAAWGGDTLTTDETITCLEAHIASNKDTTDKLFEIERCPNCLSKKLSKKNDIDIITHFAICGSKDWSIVNKLLVASYVSPQLATKRWFSKLLIKISYGKYQLGSNSANILVQDRLTGVILEEKIGVYVRLGIRLLYQGLDTARRKRVRALMKKMSIKQGSKFDHPNAKYDIPSFIKFHKLNLDECLEPDPSKYETFNDFFYRKLKPEARPIEAEDNDLIATSPADCRCVAFDTVNSATEVWVKGRNFTIAKLFNGNFYNLEDSDFYKGGRCCMGVFRLAPQDYHRFHSPVAGIIKKIKFIDGEYYTVNPMAIRSELDVFGENIRAIIAIETKSFGTVIMIPVGAMMVGSIVLTKGENSEVKKGEEVGYFKFGGSTIILLFQYNKFRFDSDLINNSKSSIETLVRVGQSIGHSPKEREFRRDKIDFEQLPKDIKRNLIRVITGGDLNVGDSESWETSNLKMTASDMESITQDYDSEVPDELT